MWTQPPSTWYVHVFARPRALPWFPLLSRSALLAGAVSLKLREKEIVPENCNRYLVALASDMLLRNVSFVYMPM